MKFRNLAIIASALCLAATASAQTINSFTNLNFEAGVQNFPTGFDVPENDVPGWMNYTAITDSGTEGPTAWWGTYNGGYSAFMAGGNGAYNLSDYTIQAGDVFTVDFLAKSWPWTSETGIGEWTVSLFYDAPANIFGSYTTPPLGDNSTWVPYTSTPIAATLASEGGKLGVIFLSSGDDISQLDEVVVAVPEPSVISLMAVAGLGMLLRRRQLVK